MKRFLPVFLLLGLSSVPALAEDFPFESGSADAEFKKGFGDKEGLTQKDKDLADEDRLKIGGSLWSELTYVSLDPDGVIDSFFGNQNSLWLYLDSRLKNDIRGYVKVKAIYDPTVNAGVLNPFTGDVSRGFVSDLEELKILFNLSKKAFLTVGKQKIKWGSGKFWNATDFLNNDQRNFLYSQDLRSGVSLIKTHVPVGASNFYMVQKLDGADQPEEVKHAFRAEVPFLTAEAAGSVLFSKDRDPVFGLDVSTALWELDAYGEISYTASTASTPNESLTHWVVGLSYDWQYLESDTLQLSLEYFRNGAGVTDTSKYYSIVTGGGYEPFRLSREYGMLMILMQEPGSWNDVSFVVFNLANLTDHSAMTRIETQLTGLQDLTFAFSVGAHYGNGNGEFKFGGQAVDVATRLMIDF